MLTELRPGPVRIIKQSGAEEVFHVSGGYLEVQPNLVTVLTDRVVDAKDRENPAEL